MSIFSEEKYHTTPAERFVPVEEQFEDTKVVIRSCK
jgi:hypothetical protein